MKNHTDDMPTNPRISTDATRLQMLSQQVQTLNALLKGQQELLMESRKLAQLQIQGHQVFITEIDIPFWELVTLMVKVAIASIPATIIVTLIIGTVIFILAGLLGGIISALVAGLLTG